MGGHASVPKPKTLAELEALRDRAAADPGVPDEDYTRWMRGYYWPMRALLVLTDPSAIA